MSDTVENLVLEHLRSIRGDIARLADGQDTMKTDFSIIRQHVACLVGSQTLDNGSQVSSSVSCGSSIGWN